MKNENDEWKMENGFSAFRFLPPVAAA